jgi:hypothetical protein
MTSKTAAALLSDLACVSLAGRLGITLWALHCFFLPRTRTRIPFFPVIPTGGRLSIGGCFGRGDG